MQGDVCVGPARLLREAHRRAGDAKLREAGRSHLADIDELFLGRYSGSELRPWAELLSRLPTTGADCRGDEPRLQP